MNVRVALFIFTWNDELMIGPAILFYRSVLGNGVDITVVDNESYDKTTTICKRMRVRVQSYGTNNLHDDVTLRKMKNECWKGSDADWVIVVDADEWVDVSQKDLAGYTKRGVTIVEPKGFEMVSESDTTNLFSLRHSVRNTLYDKPCIFDHRAIVDICFTTGCHDARPVERGGDVHWWNVMKGLRIQRPTLYHMKYYSLAYLLDRVSVLQKRQAPRQGKLMVSYNVQDTVRRFLERRSKATKHDGLPTIFYRLG